MKPKWYKWYVLLQEVRDDIDHFLESAEVETKDVGPLTDISEKLHDLMDRVYQRLTTEECDLCNE